MSILLRHVNQSSGDSECWRVFIWFPLKGEQKERRLFIISPGNYLLFIVTQDAADDEYHSSHLLHSILCEYFAVHREFGIYNREAEVKSTLYTINQRHRLGTALEQVELIWIINFIQFCIKHFVRTYIVRVSKVISTGLVQCSFCRKNSLK